MDEGFMSRLNASQRFSLDPVWEVTYRHYFPELISITNHQLFYGPHQLQGIDRSIELKNGKRITIEEKVRRYNSYKKDLLLEFGVRRKGSSNYEPGWIEKPLACDYLLIFYKDTKDSFLFPWQHLQNAWFRNKHEGYRWCERIQPLYNHDEKYKSLPVPKDELLTAIAAECMFSSGKELTLTNQYYANDPTLVQPTSNDASSYRVN